MRLINQLNCKLIEHGLTAVVCTLEMLLSQDCTHEL